MTTIVTRAGKGSALTWTEGDSNFTNLNTAKLENVVEDLTPQLGGDLDVNGKKITSASNGNVDIEPNGTGDVYLKSDTVYVGEAAANVSILGLAGSGAVYFGSDGAVGFYPGNSTAGVGIGDNLGLNPVSIVSGSSGITMNTTSGNITFTNDNAAIDNLVINGGANGNITLEPNGTGDVNLNTDTVRIGDSGAAATITTNGAGNLTLNTNAGTNSGSIAIAAGANGNITIAPNGTGVVSVQGLHVGVITSTAGSSPIAGRHTATANASIANYSFNVQKHRTDILLAAMTNEPAVIGFSVRDSGNNNRFFGRLIANYNGTGTNPYFQFSNSTDGFTTNNIIATIGNGTGTWGQANAGYTHTTNGTGTLTLNTNSGTNSGTIVINQGANANITVTPNGTGKTVITNAVPYEYVYTAGSTTGTITPNAANGTIQSITLTGSITFNAFATPLAGQTITMIIKQPAAGGPYTLTSTMLFAGASKTLSTAANAVDILTVTYDGTNYWASLSKGYA